MPVTRIEFRRIKCRGDGWWKDNYETVLRAARSIPTFFLHNENQSTIKIQTCISGSPPRSDGVDETDGRREPDSGLGYIQAYRSRWTHEDCVDPDSVSQRTEQPAGRKCRVGGRPAGDQIPEETPIHRNSRWDIPRKRALFTSDGPDSTTSGSDTLESHADWPPDVEYSERLMTDKQQDEGGTERLCSPHLKLEMAVIQLQKDFDDCRTEFEIVRKLNPAVDRRPPRQARFTSKPLCVRTVGTMSRRPCSFSLIWMEMHSTSLC